MTGSEETKDAGRGPADRTAIGISLGNSNCSIAFTVDDRAEVIANEDGDRQIPTVLSYVGGEEYYGTQAKSFLVRNSSNTVAYFKEFIGQEFKSIDPTHCHASAHPVDVDGTISFTIKDKETDDESASPSTLSVVEITARYIRRLVESASEYIGKKVTSAVISVPTNFSENQRKALIQAATAADLEVLQLISEPAAILLAYDARPGETGNGPRDKMVVVADLGGTRSDVSVVACRGGMYSILATSHDYEFAGVHLDQILMDHFAKEFIKAHKTDPRTNDRSLSKLRLESEATKKALSLGTNAAFSVESLADGNDFSCTINRTRYEMLARKVLDGFNRLVEGTVTKAGLDILDIDEVILSGGTSHTPRIAHNMRAIFPLTTSIVAPATSTSAVNPSELLARGTALQASLIFQYESEDIEQSAHPAVTTVQHTSNAIGVVSIAPDGTEIFTSIMPAETAVPARRTVQVPVPGDGGDVLVRVVEGGAHINVTKPERRPKEEKAETEGGDDGHENDEDEDEEEEEEEEDEKREKEWKIGSTLAEAAIKETKKGAKIEVTINVLPDLGATITAREVNGKGGVRGSL